MLDPLKRRYALQIPGTQLFVDGNWEHSIADGPRAPAVYARGCCTAAPGLPGGGDNQPNGRVELWPILKEGEQSFKKVGEPDPNPSPTLNPKPWHKPWPSPWP